MLSKSPYNLAREMLETPDILRRFDPARVADWAAPIDLAKRLLITGEGSSRIFPAKNMIDLSLRDGMDWRICTEGARQAAEYDLNGFIVMGASNSGRTRELISLFEKLTKKGISCFGITATGGSVLAGVATDCRVLSCGSEKAVPATKSVVETALIYQALLGGGAWESRDQAADYCGEILARAIPSEILDCIANAPMLYFCGRNNGVAEELRLKANEIARKKSDYLEGTYALHGIEEVMDKAETVILIEPFREEIEKYQAVLSGGVGMKVIALASFATPFPTMRVPALKGFDAYMQLLAGWSILAAAGIANGVDIDNPRRARKVGNAV